MRNILIVWLTCWSLVLCAQAPPGMSYQAVIRDAGGELVTERPVGVRLSILQGGVEGAAVYTETHRPDANANGLVSLVIGQGDPVHGDLAGINWADGPYFLKTETDPGGGSDYSISGTTQLLSVPYALHATTAERLAPAQAGSRYIGELYGGGIVFHIWRGPDGEEHGLIASLNNLSTGHMWSNVQYTLIGPDAQSIWDGAANTQAIIAQDGHTTSAAQLCTDYTGGGLTDWYLPAIDELILLYNQRYDINRNLAETPGADLVEYWYWTSTENAFNDARHFYFYLGSTNSSFKYKESFVRAVRRF